MGDDDEQSRQATNAERLALERLLVRYHHRLLTDIRGKLPDDARQVISPEDIAQETYIVAFRKMGEARLEEGEGFYYWLAKIAEHKVYDAVKFLRRAKRGGGKGVDSEWLVNDTGSLLALLELLWTDSTTPSRSAAEREVVAAVRAALSALKEEYRVALQLRHIEGLPVKEVAARMSRTEAAVLMLCQRGLRKLQEELGDVSRFLA